MAPHDNLLYVVQPTAQHTHTVILLHGLGDTAKTFGDVFCISCGDDGRRLPQMFPSIKWIFPSSQHRESFSWFDITSVEEPQKLKELQQDSLTESMDFVVSVVDGEMATVPAHRIFLGGISQGCATAIHALLMGEVRLAGFIGFCSWMPFQQEVEDGTSLQPLVQGGIKFDKEFENSPGIVDPDMVERIAQLSDSEVLKTPVFLSHNVGDPTVPVANGRALRNTLEGLLMDVEWHQYRAAYHWINDERDIPCVADFIRRNTGLR